MSLFFIILISLIFGSFASCVSYRLANSEKFIFVRSKCPKCGKALGFLNLIPIFSYIFQKGRCSNCHQKISKRYILIELFFLLSFILIFLANGSNIDDKLIFYLIFATILVIMSIVDLEHYFIPDNLQILLFLASIIYIIDQFGVNSLLDYLISAILFCLFGVFLYLLFKFSANVSAIGIDDIKLLFIIGFVIGLKSFLLFIFLTGIFGIIFGSLWVSLKKDETFPFAPALCLSMMICVIYGQNIDISRIITKIIF